MRYMKAKNLTIRLTDVERRTLDHKAGQLGTGPSTLGRAYVRRGLGLDADPRDTPPDAPDHGEAIEDHERRLSRLEEMAGL